MDRRTVTAAASSGTRTVPEGLAQARLQSSDQPVEIMVMLEALHTIGSRIRHARLLGGKQWLWGRIEPHWQRVFARLTRQRGFLTHVNMDEFRLIYEFGARYDRFDQREYEAPFYRVFVDSIMPGMTVLDLGAHVGFFTLGAAKRVGRSGRVYAFEPAPETAQILARHVALNGWSDRVEIVGTVVSDVIGITPFYVHGATMAASLARENIDVISPEEHATPALMLHVPAVTLDQFCADRGIKPDVIKIDVEGAELHVLRGAKALLASGAPRVLCEIHPDTMRFLNASDSDLEQYAASLGYIVIPLDERNALGNYHAMLVKSAGSGEHMPASVAAGVITGR